MKGGIFMTEKELHKQLLSLSPKELEKMLSQYNRKHKTQFSNSTTTTQIDKLAAAGINSNCPYCGSSITVKRGQELWQRYLCKDCNKSFTSATGTLLDGSSFTYEQWVQILGMTINGFPVADMVNVLQKDFGLTSISESTVHLARHKIFHFVSLLPQPKLTGVIQIDETFFRENQKASKTLVNHIPEVVQIRKPRYGYNPSAVGVMGSEFVNVPVAIDNSGHVVAKVACMGKLDLLLFQSLFEEHLVTPAYICTDANPIYGKFCCNKNIPHYVRPSQYVSIIYKAGYDQARYTDQAMNEIATKKNTKILQSLYSAGQGDRIDYKGKLTFQQFQKLKYENHLNLGRVNQFHGQLKRFINTNKKGVSSKFLDKYIAFYVFLHNWKVDHGNFPSATSDFEEVLLYILKNTPHSSFTAEDYKNTELQLPKPSAKYIQQLANMTSSARQEFNSKYLKLNEEDRVYNFKKREYLLDCPKVWIFQAAKENKLSVKSKMSQWEMVRQLLQLPNIDAVIVDLLLKEKKIFIDQEDRDLLAYFKINADEIQYNAPVEDVVKSHYPIVKPQNPLFNPNTYLSSEDDF